MSPQVIASPSETTVIPTPQPQGAQDGDRHAPEALPRVLMVTHRTPFPPDKGDRIRTFNVLRYLAAHAHVDLATLADEPVTEENLRGLQSLARRVEIVRCDSPMRWVRAGLAALGGRSATEGLFASRELHRRIARLLADARYDLIVVVCSSMAPYIERRSAKGAATLIDLIDVDSQKWVDYAAAARGWRRWAYSLEARRVRQLEAALADRYDHIAVTTPAEAECYRAFQARGQVAAIANGVDFDYFHPTTSGVEKPQSCVFVGALDYKPNVDGMAWFCEHVWPVVRDQRPSAELTIVGRRPVAAVERLANVPGVKIVANVPDVRPYLAAAQVVVAPLLIARGVQNKVLEALAAGKPVIASPQAIEGLDVGAGIHLLQAADATQWIAALGDLWDHEGDRRRLGAAARDYVVDRHSWDRCLAPIGALLAQGEPQPTR